MGSKNDTFNALSLPVERNCKNCEYDTTYHFHKLEKWTRCTRVQQNMSECSSWTFFDSHVEYKDEMKGNYWSWDENKNRQ